MSKIKEENQLRDELNKQLAESGYRLRLKSVKRTTYEGTPTNVRSTNISYEFEQGGFERSEINNASLFLGRLIRQKL